MNRDEIFAAADEEADFNIAAEALEDKDEITIDDLRTLPGVTDEMSDDDVLAAWKEVQSGGEGDEEQIAAAAGAESAVKTSRGYKLYDESGQEIGDISKLSAEQLLKSKIGYNANKSEQRKTLDEIVRVAQYGHLNEGKLSVAQRERDDALERLTKQEPVLAEAMRVNGAVRYAVTQFLLGDETHLKSFISAFQKQMGAGGVTPAQQAPTQPDSSAGIKTYYEEILPSAYTVADRYGARREEMRAVVDNFINTTRNLTREKLNQYIEEEIPLILESQGYSIRQSAAPVQAADPRDTKIAELEKKLASKTKVDSVLQLRNRNKNIPSAGSRESMDSGSADGPVVPAAAIKSRADFKKFLEN
jgi:hypothetical protein